MTKTVILCGGIGTRLREQTEFIPKPLVHIGDRPILWHIMNIYKCYGFTEFILCLGYKGNAIKDYFLNYEWFSNDFTLDLQSRNQWITHGNGIENWKITFADTGLETLTGGRLYTIKKYLEGEERFMITYGDGLANIDLKRLLEFHEKYKKIGTITGAHPTSKYGMLKTTPNNVIISFQEKPRLSDYINVGFMVFEKEIFDYIDKDKMIEDVIADLVKARKIAMFPHEGFFHAMDTQKDYEDLNRIWASGNVPWKIW